MLFQSNVKIFFLNMGLNIGLIIDIFVNLLYMYESVVLNWLFSKVYDFHLEWTVRSDSCTT